jgi:hypothetical protein
MKRIYLIIIFLSFGLTSISQNGITITKIEGTFCAGSDLSVSSNTKGIYNNQNKFKVQYRCSSKTLWLDLNTEGASSPLKASLPKELDQPLNYSDFNFYFRIVSSSPSFEGETYGYIQLKGLPSIKIYPDNIVPIVDLDERVNVRADISGYSPITLKLNDSIEVKNFYNNVLSGFTFFPEKTGEYFVSQISNVCGVGTASGKINIIVNDFGFKLISNHQLFACPNSKVEIVYSSTGIFNKDNKFTVRLTNYQNTAYYDIKANENNGIITFILPASLPVDPNGRYYKISVLSSSPALTSTGFLSIYNVGPPSVEVSEYISNNSIFLGEKVLLPVYLNGVGPFNITLSDGTTYTHTQSNFSQGFFSANVFVSPTKNTDYFIKSFTSDCGPGGIGKNIGKIKVSDVIIADTIFVDKQYCPGEKIRIPFKTNAIIGLNEKVIIRLSKDKSDYGNVVDIEGKLIEQNLVEFILPVGIVDKVRSLEPFVKVFTNIVAGLFKYSKILINEKPSQATKFYQPNNETYDVPKDLNLFINSLGIGITDIILNDSLNFKTTFYNLYSESVPIPIRVNQTTNFKITSVSNNCGTTLLSSSTKTISIQNPLKNNIFFNEPLKTNYCGGSKINVKFNPSGVFDKDNEFKVEILSDLIDEVSVLSTVNKNNTEVTLPSVNSAARFRLRISSTSPKVSSNFIYIYLQKKPQIQYVMRADGSNPYVGNSFTEYFFSEGGGPYEIVKNDGSILRTKADFYNNSSISTTGIIQKNGKFGIVSISNLCGLGTIKSSTVDKIVPYVFDIADQSGYLNNSCIENTFKIVINKIGEGQNILNYNLEIAPEYDTTYTSIYKNLTTHSTEIKIPANYQNGIYNLRAVSNDGLNIRSSPIRMFIQKKANIILSNEKGSNEVTIYGGEDGAKLQIKTSEKFTQFNSCSFTMIDDKKNKYPGLGVQGDGEIKVVNPLETTTYSLKSVYNLCGYGTVTGSVKVIVKPNVKLSISQKNPSTVCAGEEIKLDLKSFGNFEKDNQFIVKIYRDSTKKKEVLVTSKEGVYNVKIPSDFQSGFYQVELNSTNPVQKKIIQNIRVSVTPEIVLSGGGAIANQGEQVTLLFNTNPTQDNFTYEDIRNQLSDSTSGTIYNSGKSYITTQPLYVSKTFSFISASNYCGIGKVSGNAKIIINPVSTKQVNFISSSANLSYACQGGTLLVSFNTKGIFSGDNKFIVQLSDSNGENFKDIKTDGIKSPILTTIPINLPIGNNYRLRVKATDTDATSTTNYYPLEIKSGVTARFDSSLYYLELNKQIPIPIKFTGNPPFNFTFEIDEFNMKSASSYTNSYTLIVNPTKTTTYKLLGVNNYECGTGYIIEQSKTTEQLITSTEDNYLKSVQVFPNPTIDLVKILSNSLKLNVEIFNQQGKLLLEKKIDNEYTEINLQEFPASQYILKNSKDGKFLTYRIIKE